MLDFLKDKLPYRKQAEIRNKLEEIDMIFYYIFRPDRIDLKVKNKNNEVILCLVDFRAQETMCWKP